MPPLTRLQRALAARPTQLALIALTTLAYALVYLPLRARLGAPAGLPALVPVLLTGWWFGLRAGLLAGLATPLLNALLLSFAGQPGFDLIFRDTTGLGPLAALAVGAIIGRFSDLNRALQRQILEHRQAREALSDSLDRFGRLVEASTEGVAILGQDRILDANPALAAMFGYELAELRGRPAAEFVAPESREKVAQHIRAGHEQPYEALGLRQDGTQFPIRVVGRAIRHDGQLARVTLVEDLTERRQAEAALRASQQLFESAFRNAAIGMALVSPAGRWLQVNQALCDLLGYAEHELLATTFQALTHPDDLEADLEYVRQMLTRAIPTYHMEKRYFHRRGHVIWALLSVSLVWDSRDQPLYFLSQIQDITARKQTEAQLQHAATHDALTGLPNRALLLDRLSQALERRRRRADFGFALLFLDLDRFKVVNDSLGHLAGDQLLIAVAQRLAACVRALDTVARLGGDEFVLLLEDVQDLPAVTHVADRLQHALQQHFALDGHDVFLSASIGIVACPRLHAGSGALAADRPEDILRDADAAMYRAKALGKTRYEVFHPELRTEAVARLRLETDLRRALDQHEFRLHYQPIVALTGGQVVGFEALLRWQHPDLGLLFPAAFIAAAEETGLIVPIGHWVLRTACGQLANWHARFPHDPPLTVSVNLSARQVVQPDLDQLVRDLLAAHQLPPGNLRLEITERTLIDDTPETAGLLARLKALGVKLEIDDFGTGYSALGYLQRLHLDAVKIDRSFTQQLGPHGSHGALVRTILALGQSLDLDIIAEGVETEEQWAALRSLGCRLGQGYLFGRPMEPAAVEQRLAASASLPP
jgi:diguanylate cyclase (GGDEF)-like protein/PAS domain S-box-containing protein